MTAWQAWQGFFVGNGFWILLTKFISSKKDEINIVILISISLIIAGGLGNLIDRIFRGYVIDYIDINPLFKYPVFNIADIFVVLGTILLCIYILFFLYYSINIFFCLLLLIFNNNPISIKLVINDVPP